MQTNRRVFVTLVVCVVTVTGAMAALQVQRRVGPTTSIQERGSDEDYPITDFVTPEPVEPEKRASRRAKGSRYDLHDSTVNDQDINRFKLKEESAPLLLDLPLSHAPAEPALPVSQSDAVVIGEIVDAKAFLSNDQTSLYSEFTIRIEQALKEATPTPLMAGDSIVAERRGGGVRFPSGKVLRRGSFGKNSPRVGRRYVLFLKRNNDSQDFSIITGYELRAGKVLPLDNSPEGDGKFPQFAAYESFKDADETTFLSIVRAAVLDSVKSSTKEGGKR